jgi:thiol-disulfide isomerase/thioredoxin
MKQMVLAAFFAVCLTTQVGAQGIEFFHGPWSEALAKAKTEDRLIFVDAFASWCGPCKRMAAETFTNGKVGEFFNSNFICLKIDMEKPENAEFAGKFPVSAYPTVMFIDTSGKIVSKDVGYREADPLIEMGQKALGKMVNTTSLEKSYADGKRDPKFLYDYVRALNRNGKPSLKITNEYLATQQDLTTDFNLKFIFEGAVEADSRVFDLLLKNRDKISSLVGKDPFENRVELACKNTIKKAIEFKSEELLEEAKTKMKAGWPARADAFAYEMDIKYYASTKDIKKYLKSVQAYQKGEIKNNAARLHDLVVNMLRTFPDDPKVLEQAEKWAKTSAENGGLPEYYLTLAEVYKREGDKTKARTTAEKARSAAGEKDNGIKAKIEYFLNSLS